MKSNYQVAAEARAKKRYKWRIYNPQTPEEREKSKTYRRGYIAGYLRAWRNRKKEGEAT